MDTEEEYNFIRSADFYLDNGRPYYLSGTTNKGYTAQNYSDYIPNDSGKSIYHTNINEKKCLYWKLCV